ncbi:MAG TPA: DUF3455 domain-containing protein [Gemmatimonadaceae bacterium]|nr:DUF3455 domain-containing protein [Gemmatimonadaceae bacterium]
MFEKHTAFADRLFRYLVHHILSGTYMMNSSLRTIAHLIAGLAATGLFMGCADRVPVGPDAASAARLDMSAGSRPGADAVLAGRFPDLGSCQNLNVPDGSKVTFHVFGIGVQIYRWNGASWSFVNPSANLYADAGGNGLVGTHFGGPTWRTNSGSTVVGTVAANGRCTPDDSAISWLLLDAAASGSGVFNQTTLIQRLNTVGGIAPAQPGSFVGQEADVPYTADYYFYRTP